MTCFDRRDLFDPWLLIVAQAATLSDLIIREDPFGIGNSFKARKIASVSLCEMWSFFSEGDHLLDIVRLDEVVAPQARSEASVQIVRLKGGFLHLIGSKS